MRVVQSAADLRNRLTVAVPQPLLELLLAAVPVHRILLVPAERRTRHLGLGYRLRFLLVPPAVEVDPLLGAGEELGGGEVAWQGGRQGAEGASGGRQGGGLARLALHSLVDVDVQRGLTALNPKPYNPRPQIPYPFLGYQISWLGSVFQKCKGVRYDPLGRVSGFSNSKP